MFPVEDLPIIIGLIALAVVAFGVALLAALWMFRK